MSRFWQSFNTRYNVYFNASQAYIEGDKAKESAHKDNYTELLPVFLVGNKSSQTRVREAMKQPLPNAKKPFHCIASNNALW